MAEDTVVPPVPASVVSRAILPCRQERIGSAAAQELADALKVAVAAPPPPAYAPVEGWVWCDLLQAVHGPGNASSSLLRPCFVSDHSPVYRRSALARTVAPTTAPPPATAKRPMEELLDEEARVLGGLIARLPLVKARRPFEDDKPGEYLESDHDFLDNNAKVATWILENAPTLRRALEAALGGGE